MTTTHTHTRNSCLACSSTFPSASPAPQRPGLDRNFGRQAPLAPTSSPWCAFATPGMLSRPPVPASCRGRWAQKTGLWVLNWIWRARRKRQTSHPPVSHAEFFLFLFFFLKTAASQHCFSNTAFSTEMPKTAGLGTEEKRDCSTRSIHFSGDLFSSHILEHVSRLFITVFAFHCYRFMSMPNSVWGKWSFRNLNVFLFLVYFFNVFATLSPRWVCWFYLPCLVSICVSPPPTYRTIFLKSLISVFIHTFFFSFFWLNLGHVAYIHFTNCFILCFTESFISD